MACNTLRWGHLAPSAPDTLCELQPSSAHPLHLAPCCAFLTPNSHIPLRIHPHWPLRLLPTGCYPFTDRDPFLISQRPRIYFIGNQPRFATALFEPQAEVAADAEERGIGSRGTTRVLLLPSFKRTGTLVLVNKKSLQVKLLHILPSSLAEPKPEPVERE